MKLCAIQGNYLKKHGLNYFLLLEMERIKETARIQWERDTQQEFEQKERDETHKYVKSTSANEAIGENVYK